MKSQPDFHWTELYMRSWTGSYVKIIILRPDRCRVNFRNPKLWKTKMNNTNAKIISLL